MPKTSDSTSSLHHSYATHFSRLNPHDAQLTISRGFEANILPWLPPEKDARILEYGCGTGYLLKFLMSMGYTQVEGIDISESQIEVAHSRGAHNARYLADPLSWLESKSSLYECIASFDVMEHIPKGLIVPTMKTARRALTLDGVFICRVPNIAGPLGPTNRYKDFTHETAFTEWSLEQALEAAGFRDIRIFAETNVYRRKFVGYFFESVRKIFFLLWRASCFLQAPGTEIPRIFSKNLYGVGKR